MSGFCPICQKPSAQEAKPFCSKRCKDVDLARWFGGRYAVAGAMAEEEEISEDGGGEPPVH